MKGRIALLLSVAAGVLALIAMSLYLSAREAALLEQAAMQDVVVATRDVLANTVVDERVLQVIQVPQKYLQPGAITALSDAVGRVAAVPLPRGSQVTGTSLVEGGREALAFEVPRGMRAVTVAVSDVSGVGGLIRPGNFVDIVGTFEYGVPSGSAGGEITYTQEKTETMTLAQNVQVIAVGRELSGIPPEQPPPPEEGEGPRPEARVELTEIKNITVLLGPAQVQEVVLAQQVGTLTASLRSNLDAGQVIDLERLDTLGLLRVQIPLKSRPQPSWRELRGSKQF